MKALIVVALVAASAPALAAASSAAEAAETQRDRKFCTRIETRSGSRLAYRRVCLTETQWRDRLGDDWRIELAGRSPQEDLEAIDVRTRVHSTMPTSGLGGSGAATGSLGPR